MTGPAPDRSALISGRFFLAVLSLILIAVLWVWVLGPRLFRPPAAALAVRDSLVPVRVPILVYHSVRPIAETDPAVLKYFSVAPEMFGRQLDYLKTHGYSVISFDELVAYLTRRRPLPPRPVILCFDDGWANQYQYAFPQLKARGQMATFFIFTNSIGAKHYMTLDNLKELAAAGMTIGSHTRSHPRLYQMTDPDKLWDEIAGSKAILEKKLGRPVEYFAYPYGKETEQSVALVKQAGYKAARDGHWGYEQTAGGLYDLRIIYVENGLAQFKDL